MSLLAPLFNGLTQLRAKLYSGDYLKRVCLPIPVISIGNITMGGTGKTPFTLWLLEKYQQHYKIGVVVRSYKTNLKKPMRVQVEFSDPTNRASRTFGDEAVLIQKNLPNVIVYSGPCKFVTALELYQNEKPDLIFVDDGFQHLKLIRDLDIVLLDCSVPLTDYSWPPFGRAREGFTALNRARLIVLTKTEIKNEETYSCLKRLVPKSALVLESEQVIGKLFFAGGKVYQDDLQFLANKKVFAFAGLAQPENFRRSLKALKFAVSEFMPLADHVHYDSELINKITEKSKNYDLCITTEKDAVKLGEWPDTACSLYVAPIELRVKGNLEGFYEKVDECIRQKH
jgi:tetraacyldisaccharide 4'-kinase